MCGVEEVQGAGRLGVRSGPRAGGEVTQNSVGRKRPDVKLETVSSVGLLWEESDSDLEDREAGGAVCGGGNDRGDKEKVKLSRRRQE